MEDMLRKIVEADEAAKAVHEKNRIEKERLEKELEAQAQAIYDSYMQKAKKEVEQNSLYEETNANTTLKETQQKYDSALIKLKAEFDANCERWSDEIVKRTIG